MAIRNIQTDASQCFNIDVLGNVDAFYLPSRFSLIVADLQIAQPNGHHVLLKFNMGQEKCSLTTYTEYLSENDQKKFTDLFTHITTDSSAWQKILAEFINIVRFIYQYDLRLTEELKPFVG